MRYGPPTSGQAYHLTLHHLRQPSALDAPWIRLLPAQVPMNVAEPTILCRCAARSIPDEYGHEVHPVDRYLRSAVRLQRVRMPANAPPREPALGDAWAFLIGRCLDCGTVWWAPLEASGVRGRHHVHGGVPSCQFTARATRTRRPDMITPATPARDLHADAAARMATLTTAQVCEQWMHTDELMADYALPQDDRLAVIQVRQWIMTDLERRDDAALVAWIESGQDDPAPFYVHV